MLWKKIIWSACAFRVITCGMDEHRKSLNASVSLQAKKDGKYPPPVNSQQIFLLGERGSGHDSGEKFKSRVKRGRGMIFRTHYKKEKFLDSEKSP